MEPLESNELPEQELDRLLREWKSPPVPAGFYERVLGRLAIGRSVAVTSGRGGPIGNRPQVGNLPHIAAEPSRGAKKLMDSGVADSWWGRFWHMSIRIPLPVACCLAILLMVFAWRWQPSGEIPKFQPVLELRPRIIKVQNAD